jgi:pimeloyl-ACP methyl ester carboxylesterase
MNTPFPYPVIVLPGIMGTALRDEYPVGPETVWSPLRLLVKDFERITLHPSDVRYELKEPARVVADQLFEIAYEDFIEELRHNLTPKADQPVPVFPFAYDWRQPLEELHSQLAEFIDEVLDRTKLLRHYHEVGFGKKVFPAKVNLAGHSMGGVIISGYLKEHGFERIHKIATIATPFRGSLEAVSKAAMGVATLGPTSGSSREREAARVTPSLYYLLPSFEGAVTTEKGTGLTSDLFLPRAWQPGVVESLTEFVRLYAVGGEDASVQAQRLFKKLLDSAWAYREGIEKLKVPDSRRWLSIVGIHAKTRVTMNISPDATGKPRFDLSERNVKDALDGTDPTALRTLTGDNTVPYLGARTSFIPTNQVVCVTPGDYGLLEFKDRLLSATGFHSTITNMNLVQRLVVMHFKGATYGVPGGHPPPDLAPDEVWTPPIRGLK